jgi:hypothetical protein
LFPITSYSIGIYEGKSPVKLSSSPNVNNPVLTSDDVTDVVAKYIADPFMIKNAGKWYMFFEVINKLSNKGEIGLATSDDSYLWKYKQIVLDEPFHLSYPYVIKYNDNFYMIPESMQANYIRLYKATEFPIRWSFEINLIHYPLTDPSIFNYNNTWWIFACDIINGYNLHLYYASDIYGPWIEHPKSPIVEGLKRSRPGGRVIISNGSIIRYAQDNSQYYGRQLRAFLISRLTTEDYAENEILTEPVLKGSGSGWNSIGMHNIDPHQIGENRWIACVDGLKTIWQMGMK